MPKKEEILVKDDKLNKEKISENTTSLEKDKKAKTTKSTSASKAKKSTTTTKKKTTTTKKVEKTDKAVEEKKTKSSASKTTKTTKTTKKSPAKKVEDKKVELAKKTKEPKKDSKNANKKIEEKPKTTKKEKIEIVQEEPKIDELSVIEKIKSFIAKIAAMQEEARKESLAEKEEKETKKETKTAKASKSKSKSKTAAKEIKKYEYMIEYYDLPYRYNETVVKILAQTPKRMFVYWDISDSDREKYIKTFGEDFFEKTYPVLLLYNEDKKYIKEIQINDFANSWYIDIPDPKTKYSIQLGRKFRTYNEVVTVNMQKVQENQIILHTDYLPFANSNVLEVPNDRVLLDFLPKFIKFRNVKTNEETMRELKDIKNIFGNNYDVKEFYEEHYKDELSEGMFDMANPSSNLSSSSFK